MIQVNVQCTRTHSNVDVHTNFAQRQRYALTDASHSVRRLDQQTHAPRPIVAIECHFRDEAEHTAVPLARAGQRVGPSERARVEHVASRTDGLITSRKASNNVLCMSMRCSSCSKCTHSIKHILVRVTIEQRDVRRLHQTRRSARLCFGETEVARELCVSLWNATVKDGKSAVRVRLRRSDCTS